MSVVGTGVHRFVGKKTPGGAGTVPGHTLWTHTGHTGQTGARGHTDHTDEPHNYPPKPNDTNPHENRTDHTDRYVGTNERPENSRERQYFLTNLATMCLA